MNRSWTRALPLALAALACATPAFAQIPWTVLSPWTLNRSGYYLQSTVSYLSTDESYDVFGGKNDEIGNYRELTTTLHLEYGIRNRIGLSASVPIRAMKFDATPFPEAEGTGFSDLTVALKYRALDGPVTVSVQGEAKMPTGYNQFFAAIPLGDGAWAYGGRVLGGWWMEDFPGFVQGAVGYRVRSNNKANDILLNVDGGFWATDQVLLGAHFERNDHVGGYDEGGFQDLMQWGADVRYRYSRHIDFLGGAFLTTGGQNTFAGPRFFVGVTYKGNRLPKYAGFLSSTMDDVIIPPAAPVTPPPAATPEPEEEEEEEPDAPDDPEVPETPNR